MRETATILHLDLDAFFAAVEQRDKPSLRGRAVVVGGVGGRGVVSTASYEARVFGVRSAMSTREARGRCPHAAYLSGRFAAYRETSRIVMEVLRAHSPLIEPLSLDEAFLDLAPTGARSVPEVTEVARSLREQVRRATGGLTASVGVATSKFMAKVASDLEKPDGLVVVRPGAETDLLHPMPVRTIPGVGPATAERLRRAGVTTVAGLASLGLAELVQLVGQAQGRALHDLARARDERRVEPERETKSVSVEGTYERDLNDRTLMADLLTRQAGEVAGRLRGHGLSGRTVTVKIRRADFSTLSRSQTLASPTDDRAAIARTARALLETVDTSGGVRLLGVGVSGLADWVQEDLFAEAEWSAPVTIATRGQEAVPPPDAVAWTVESQPMPDVDPASGQPAGSPDEAGARGRGGDRRFAPGQDVEHPQHGHGWVWGSGHGVVTVRFETALTGPGPVRSLREDDPELTASDPLPVRPLEELG